MHDRSPSAGAANSACAHAVHFCDHDYPADAASDFIAAGLRAGEGCILLLTLPHRHAVEQRLRALGLDPQQAPNGPRGSYQSIDTHEALAAMQVDGQLDLARAREMLATLFDAAANGGMRGARAVGDRAPTLLASGQADDAVALESLVDRLAAAYGAKVHCAYPIADLCRFGQMQTLFDICAEHRALAFPSAQLWARGFMPPRCAS